MVSEGKWDSNFEKDWESNVWCKTDGEKEGRGPDGDVGIEGNSGSDGKGKWSEIVQACVEEGWWACSERNVGVRSEGQEEARMTIEDVEDANGEGEQEHWWIKRDGEWELERLLTKWGKSGHPRLWG